MPSYYMQTFEEAFYTGFYTLDTKIFGPEITNIRARFVSYQAMERQFMFYARLSSTVDERLAEECKKGIDQLAIIKTLRRFHVGMT